MASATEAEQLAAVDEALQQRDYASIARLTRAATTAVVCQAGCRALAVALADDHVPTSEETLHATEALVFALRAQPASAGTQQQGCRGLANLCKLASAAAPEARAVVGAGGAVEAVVAILPAHVERADVLDAACHALVCMTKNCPENCGRAHRAGALDAVLQVMRTHPTHEGVQTSCCLMLWY